MRAPHPLTRVPSHSRYSCPCVAERWWLCRWSSYVHTNAGLCGDLVSVGSVGTNYNCYASGSFNGCSGVSGTDLWNACPSPSPPLAATLEDRSEYQACLATPSTCTRLCVSLPSLEGFF